MKNRPENLQFFVHGFGALGADTFQVFDGSIKECVHAAKIVASMIKRESYTLAEILKARSL